ALTGTIGTKIALNITATTTFNLTVTNAANTSVTHDADRPVTVTVPAGWIDLNNQSPDLPDTTLSEAWSMAFDRTGRIFVATLQDGVLVKLTPGLPWNSTSFPAGVPSYGVTAGHPDAFG